MLFEILVLTVLLYLGYSLAYRNATQLIFLRGSPWSLKTHWMLNELEWSADYAVEHFPMTGEFTLRLRLGFWSVLKYGRSKLTVPVLLRGGGEAPLFDSIDIIEYAAKSSVHAERLYPVEHKKEFREWNDRTHTIMARCRYTFSLYGDNVLLKILPTALANSPVGRMLSRACDKFFLKKYGTSGVTEEAFLAELDHLDAILKDGRKYLVAGRFTYADILAATAIETAWPTNEIAVSITSVAFNYCELARKVLEAYPRLVEYRERIFSDHFSVQLTRAVAMVPEAQAAIQANRAKQQ